ncbi:hypothetical protein Tco_0208091, partial [Tanacetum coccineum]
ANNSLSTLEVQRLTFEEVTVGALTSRAHRSRNTTSRTLASIAIEVSVSLNFLLSQSISRSLGYQCPDSSYNTSNFDISQRKLIWGIIS